jgi:hypothetical protein
MRLWDAHIMKEKPQEAHAGQSAGPLQEDIRLTVDRLVFQALDTRKEAFEKSISDRVNARLQQEMRAELGNLHTEIAQSKHDITEIKTQIQTHAAQIGDLHNRCTANTATLLRIQSNLDDRQVYVTPEELQSHLQLVKTYIDKGISEVQKIIDRFTEEANERIDECGDNISQLSEHSGVKVDGGGGLGYSRETEKRLLEELGRKMDEKIATIQRNHSVASAQGSAELLSIVNAIVKNEEFDLKVKTYAGIIVNRQFGDLTHRVNEMEKLTQTNSAANAPSFNVLRDSATTASAVYSVARVV